MKLEREGAKEDLIKEIEQLASKDCNSVSAFGFHGTSVYALAYYVMHGEVCGSTDHHPENHNMPQRNDLYFYPIKDFLCQNDPRERFYDKNEAINGAISYAETIAQSHSLLVNGLGDIIDNNEIQITSRCIVDEYIRDRNYIESEIDFLVKISGKGKKDVLTAIEDSLKYKGVVLCMAESVQNDDTLRYGDARNDMRINIRGRNIISFCSGIVFLNENDRALFNSLLY